MNWLPQRTRLLTISTGVLFAMLIVQAIAENFLHIPLFSYLSFSAGEPSLGWAWQWATWPLAVFLDPRVFTHVLWLFFYYWIIGGFEARFGQRRTVQLLAAVTIGLIPFPLAFSALNMPSALQQTHPHTFAAMAASGWHARGGPRLAFFGQVTMTAEQFLGLLAGLVVFQYLLRPILVQLLLDFAAMALGIAFAHYMARGGPRRRKPKKKKRGKSGTNMRAIDGGKSNGRILH